jgi:hypothetical protein
VNKGGYAAFVTRLSGQGTALTYSTFLGGAGSDEASAIAVDSKGVAYVAGHTDSLQFPANSQPKGGRDAFVTALSADGKAQSWSTYLGGAAEDRATAVAVDGAGAAYVAGYTFSPDFRMTSGCNRTANTAGRRL